jgi:hypothetical protein
VLLIPNPLPPSSPPEVHVYRKLARQLGPAWQATVFRHVRNYDLTGRGRVQPHELQTALTLAGNPLFLALPFSVHFLL